MHAHAGVCVLVCVRACMKMLFFSLEHSPTAYLKFFYKAIPDDQDEEHGEDAEDQELARLHPGLLHHREIGRASCRERVSSPV